MIANNAAGTYGQIGWLKLPAERLNFSESNTSGGGFQQRLMSPNSVGSSPAYKVTYGSGTFQYFINGLLVDSDSAPSFGGCVSQNYAEIQNLANQMAGGYNNHELFTSAQVRRSDTGSWSYMNGTPTTTDPFLFSYSVVSSTQIEVWDNACAS